MNFPKATITGMNGKQFTEYLTPFKDDVGDNVTFVYDTDIKAYADDAYCMFELTNAGISDDYQHRIMQKAIDITKYADPGTPYGYLKSVVSDWLSQGIYTMQDWQQHQQKKQAAKHRDIPDIPIYKI